MASCCIAFGLYGVFGIWNRLCLVLGGFGGWVMVTRMVDMVSMVITAHMVQNLENQTLIGCHLGFFINSQNHKDPILVRLSITKSLNQVSCQGGPTPYRP